MKDNANRLPEALAGYARRVQRQLRMPKALRLRVMSDWQTGIQARLEQGETPAELLTGLGSPKQTAARLNEEMAEYTYRKSPWRFLALAVAVLAGLWLVTEIALWCVGQSRAASIGIIGGADGPTSILVTTTVTRIPPVVPPVVKALILGAAGVVGYILLSRRPGKRTEA